MACGPPTVALLAYVPQCRNVNQKQTRCRVGLAHNNRYFIYSLLFRINAAQ